MTHASTLLAYGTFTSDAAARTLELPSGISYFEIENRSTYGTLPGAVVKSWWQNGMTNGTAFQISEAGGTGIHSSVLAAANGITPVNTGTSTIGAAIAVTAVTAATPAVASTATTPAIGDIVRVYDTTGMLQIAGYDFTVTAVNPGVTMTFGYLPAVGFAAAATAGFYRLLPNDLTFYPRKRYITAITAAAQAVVTFSVTHDYVVGSKISFRVPAAFGMTQIDGMTGTVTAISTANNTVTVDINSTAFTAFAFPTSAIAALGVTPAHAVPAGEVATILTSAERDVGYAGLRLGTAVVGANTNVMQWRAYRGETI